jgi:hypothetical protein
LEVIVFLFSAVRKANKPKVKVKTYDFAQILQRRFRTYQLIPANVEVNRRGVGVLTHTPTIQLTRITGSKTKTSSIEK